MTNLQGFVTRLVLSSYLESLLEKETHFNSLCLGSFAHQKLLNELFPTQYFRVRKVIRHLRDVSVTWDTENLPL